RRRGQIGDAIRRRRSRGLPWRAVRRAPPRGQGQSQLCDRGRRAQRSQPHPQPVGHRQPQRRTGRALRHEYRAGSAPPRAARPLAAGASRNGRTPFDKLPAALKVANGAVTVDDAAVDGSAVRVTLGGTASIPSRELDLKGTASLLNGPNDVAFELPFVVNGPWDSPLPIPDTTSLIRRSGAAAPLLDAVRNNKKTRDAVRSALERLTSPRPTAEAAPGAADR